MDHKLFEQLEDVILNKGISIQVMLRAIIKKHATEKDWATDYMVRALLCAEEIVDTFKEVQEKYYRELDGKHSG